MKNSLKKFKHFEITTPFQISVRGGEPSNCLSPCFYSCEGLPGWGYTDCMNSCIDAVLPGGGPCPETLGG